MEYSTFYISIFVIWIALALSSFFKSMRLSHIIIGIAAIAFSLVYETSFGAIMGLYYYVRPDISLYYLLTGSIFIYAPLQVLYTFFLPRENNRIFVYTLVWIAAMLLFEHITVLTKTIVFTGWKPIPWSIVTYIATYAWVYSFYRYLNARQLKHNS